AVGSTFAGYACVQDSDCCVSLGSCSQRCVSSSIASTLYPGDCGNNGLVTVDEILTMLNSELGNRNICQLCAAGDVNYDCLSSVDEVMMPVTNLRDGCPPVGTSSGIAARQPGG